MQKTINGIRKWLSARVAAAFWEKVICAPSILA